MKLLSFTFALGVVFASSALAQDAKYRERFVVVSGAASFYSVEAPHEVLFKPAKDDGPLTLRLVEARGDSILVEHPVDKGVACTRTLDVPMGVRLRFMVKKSALFSVVREAFVFKTPKGTLVKVAAGAVVDDSQVLLASGFRVPGKVPRENVGGSFGPTQGSEKGRYYRSTSMFSFEGEPLPARSQRARSLVMDSIERSDEGVKAVLLSACVALTVHTTRLIQESPGCSSTLIMQPEHVAHSGTELFDKREVSIGRVVESLSFASQAYKGMVCENLLEGEIPLEVCARTEETQKYVAFPRPTKRKKFPEQ